MLRIKFTQVVLVRVIFTLAVIMLVMMSAFLFKRISRQVSSTEEANRTNLIRLYLEQMLSQVKAVEAGHRGFLLTGDSSFLQSFRESKYEINADLDTMLSLAEGHDSQQQVDTLRSLIDRSMFLIDSLIRVYNSSAHGVTKGNLQSALMPGRIVMEQIKEHTNRLIQTEMKLYDSEQRLKEKYRNAALLFALLLIIFVFIVFTLAYVSLNRQMDISKDYLQQKQLALEGLEEMDEIYRNAEELATLGSWQWNLKTNLFKCSDNLFRIYGTEPRQEAITFDRFMSFVVPEDRETLVKEILSASNNKESVVFSYRIVRADNEIRHMRAYGKLSAGSSDIMLGATQDVTDLKMAYEQLSAANKELAAKNRELEQTNADLSSFNFVASHDLQEPLRKIQTFVSFLEEGEPDLSEMGKFYLQRMQYAATRCRALIQDLLTYAHATSLGKERSDVDLNVVLNNVLQSLHSLIGEKNANIQVGELPVVHGSISQLTKLFEHLLSNSFKYHKPGMPPVISITSETINNEDDGKLAELEAGHSYHKISIADEGIGFEQQYAGKIFGVFQRLNTQDDDVGSGIGLAICKKIVQHHGGVIKARSALDEGSVFDIYLPA